MMRDTVDDGSIIFVVWHLYESQVVTEYPVKTKYLQLGVEMFSTCNNQQPKNLDK